MNPQQYETFLKTCLKENSQDVKEFLAQITQEESLEMIRHKNYNVLRKLTRKDNLEVLRTLLSYCSEKEKRDFLSKNDYEIFYIAARKSSPSLIMFLWDSAAQKLSIEQQQNIFLSNSGAVVNAAIKSDNKILLMMKR